MIVSTSLILMVALSACAPQPPPTPDPTLVSAIVDATVRAIPTATPPSTPTPQIPTAVPPTPIPPTPTVLPNDPALIFGAPDGSDDFSTNRNWSSFDNNCYKSGVVNGQFMMEGKGSARADLLAALLGERSEFLRRYPGHQPAKLPPQRPLWALHSRTERNPGLRLTALPATVASS